MSNLTNGSTFGRIFAGLVMGGLTFALVALTAVFGPIGAADLVHPMLKLTIPAAAIATVVIASLPSSVRTAWGRLCLMNGVVSLSLAGVSVENGQPLWSKDPLYEHALDQAMQWWVRDVIWTTAVYFAAAMIIAAA